MHGPPPDDAASRRAALERALVATAQGDRNAFATLYRLTSAKLFGICLRICGSRENAEDVVAQTYEKIWQRAGAYEAGRVSPVTWLSTLARNTAIDWRRRKANAPAPRLDDVAEPVDPAMSAEESMEETERRERLEACLSGLGEDQRHAIRTAFFGGLTYAELAEREGVPLGTMKSRIRRGLTALKDCLGGDA